MRLIDAESAASYLRQTGRIDPGESVQVRELAGGVSNVVLYVARGSDGDDFVLKQARERLRVADPWFCSVERIWREVEVLRICESVLAECDLRVEIPQVLFEDRDQFAFAMTAAPPRHVVWKQLLLQGDVDANIAEACGRLLGKLHGRTWQDPSVARKLDDRRFFEDLRLDPYYRRVAAVHDDLRGAIQCLIDSVWSNRCCLVHGDFSPKNLLVFDDRLMMIDFEVGHYGDPAFDVGFFLSHLVLKAVHSAPRTEPYLKLTETFWRAYCRSLAGRVDQQRLRQLTIRAVQNFAGCALARVDGKSKVEYLTDPRRCDFVRRLCRTLFQDRPATWDDVAALVRRLIRDEEFSGVCNPD